MRCDHLQSPVCGRHSRIITSTPSNPDSLNVWEWVAEELALGAGGRGSGCLLWTSSLSTPALGGSLRLPWPQWFYLTASQPGGWETQKGVQDPTL